MVFSVTKFIVLLFVTLISINLVAARPLAHNKRSLKAKRCNDNSSPNKGSSKFHKGSHHKATTDNGNQNLQYNGQATFYNVETGMTACGDYRKNSDFIAALSSNLYQPGSGGDSWAAPKCHARAKVEYGGKSIEVEIVDECPSCQNDSLDLSPSAFQALADPDIGVLAIKWDFISEGNPKDKAS